MKTIVSRHFKLPRLILMSHWCLQPPLLNNPLSSQEKKNYEEMNYQKGAFVACMQ